MLDLQKKKKFEVVEGTTLEWRLHLSFFLKATTASNVS